MSSGRTFKLSSGYEIPAVGLGTWQSKPNEVSKAVETALKLGYRHIDAAAVYGNEAEVGAGIKASDVLRSDIFITSKLWNSDHAAADVEPALDATLRDLGTDYVDLYLIHWPVSFKHHPDGLHFPVNPETEAIHVTDVPDLETWRAMEALVKKGKVRSIGVSNFTRAKIQNLLDHAEIKPALNQIEAHPYLQQPGLLEWSKSQGILTAAYSPSGNNIYGLPKPLDDPVVVDIARFIGKSPAQVLIQWAVQRGTVVLPKSVTPSRIAENFKDDFVLAPADVARIDALDRNHRYNFPIRLGVDIFGEHDEATLKKGVQEWVEGQRRLKAAAG